MFANFIDKARQFCREAKEHVVGWATVRWQQAKILFGDHYERDIFDLFIHLVLTVMISLIILELLLEGLFGWAVFFATYWLLAMYVEFCTLAHQGAAKENGWSLDLFHDRDEFLYVGNPIQQAYSWFTNIPNVIGLGYARAEESAKREHCLTMGALFGFVLVPLNACVFYIPKFIRWTLGKFGLEMCKGVVCLSPFVAFGLGNGHNWAEAIFGHELGHVAAFDERAYDWWWVTFAFLPDLVGAIISPMAMWITHVISVLVNEAWATYNAWRDGYVRGTGYLTLALAYSTYVMWASGIISALSGASSLTAECRWHCSECSS